MYMTSMPPKVTEAMVRILVATDHDMNTRIQQKVEKLLPSLSDLSQPEIDLLRAYCKLKC